MPKHLVLIAFMLCALFFALPAHASFDEGKAAYDKQDWMNAITHLRPLAEQGNDQALLLLGNMYNDGKGVEQNHKTARDLYQRAAELGNRDATFSLGTIYANGIGVEPNLNAALIHFTKSAEQGHPASQLFLGLAYLDQDKKLKMDIQPDPVTAYKWLSLAQNQIEMPDIKDMAKNITTSMVAQGLISEQDIKTATDAAKKQQTQTP